MHKNWIIITISLLLILISLATTGLTRALIDLTAFSLIMLVVLKRANNKS